MRVWLAAVLFSLVATAASACPVCIATPDRTVADRVLEDEIVVVARPDPERPFRFVVAEVLRGDPALLAHAPEIPFLVDAGLRRAAEAGEVAVLMTYGATDTAGSDDPYGQPGLSWHRSITLDPARRAVIEGILAEGAMWFWGGEPEDPLRFAFFAELHAHPDPVIARMALNEISRSAYGQIRALDLAIPVPELIARLGQVEHLPYHPLYALMLGASGDPAAEALVRDRAARALAGSSAGRGAWLTAWIEVDGEAAIERIAAAFLSGGTEGAAVDEALIPVLDALRVTGDARPELRPALSRQLQAASDDWPALASETAFALYGWQDWSFAPAVREMLAEGRIDDPSILYMLEVYRDTAATFGAL